MKTKQIDKIHFYKNFNLIPILTFTIGLIALSLLLWIILPNSLDYDFYFKTYTYRFNLQYPIIWLPYLGLVTAIILIIKKEKFKWLLIFSLFSILFPFITPSIKYINQTFNTNISERLQDNRTPLSIAVHSNQMEKVKILLENGANPNGTFTYNPELLHFAVENNNFELTKLLIKHGAKVNRINYTNGTPLHIAVEHNNIEIVNFLLKYRAPLNARTKYHYRKSFAFTTQKDYGKTPLHMAVQNNNYEIIKTLLEHGANPRIKDNNNKTVFDYAKNEHTTKLLKSY